MFFERANVLLTFVGWISNAAEKVNSFQIFRWHLDGHGNHAKGLADEEDRSKYQQTSKKRYSRHSNGAGWEETTAISIPEEYKVCTNVAGG
jgi:hypothetical protein